ncbi:hypothetical protein PDIDSM_5857 [Penicillium digitatum]|nr:hypothetical protein PDIDSM_5857 [Penicillium digitatum]
MADLLLQKRGTTPVLSVGEKWVSNFVKRHPLLSSRFSKQYNYERAKCEDPKIIGEWFDLVQKTILQFGIDPDDMLTTTIMSICYFFSLPTEILAMILGHISIHSASDTQVDGTSWVYNGSVANGQNAPGVRIHRMDGGSVTNGSKFFNGDMSEDDFRRVFCNGR